MPTEGENMKYLYTVMTCGGPPTIDWAKVSEELGLSKGAASKRWSRLKQSMEKNISPGPSAHQFLWLCVKHSSRDKAMDWNAIAEKCNTTAGAASKRYSRLKQAFDSGATAPQPTPSQEKDSGTGSKDSKPATPAKRKRATKTEVAGSMEEDKVKREQSLNIKEKKKENVVADPKPKRARASKKNQSKAEVKNEGSSDIEVLGERQGSQGPILPSPALLAELEAVVRDAHEKMQNGDNGRQGESLSEDEFHSAKEGTQDSRYDEFYSTKEAAQNKVASWLEGSQDANEEGEI